MKDFFSWAADYGAANKSWLILGKGPSFSEINQYDLSAFQTLSLNHAVRERRVDVAHIIDLDVVENCSNALLDNAGVVVMPWHPHVANQAANDSLETCCQRVPALQELNREGRLLWYNLSTSNSPHSGSPVVPVRYFSFEAALNLLAISGVRKVRSLGIDGGNNYSTKFEDLKGKTLLANGQPSFDLQFGEIAKILLRTGIDYAPLNIPSPVNIFVAATEDQMLAVKVLEYSIRKHASLNVRVTPLHRCGIDIPTPQDAENLPRTPFSFQRFLIPEIIGHTGHAIYLDSDMQVFQDIRKLWTLPMADSSVMAVGDTGSQRRPQFSVMLLNCSALQWDIRRIIESLDKHEYTYEDLMQRMIVAERIRADIPPCWNSLERFDPQQTALLHYTDMTTQPWVSRDNPNGYLWVRDLMEAVASGFIDITIIEQHISLGHVRPSLAYQIENRIEDALLLPRRACDLDKSFTPPYRRMASYRPQQDPPARWHKRIRRWMKAYARALGS